MFCKGRGLNFTLNYSVLFYITTHSLKTLISNLFRLPLRNLYRKLMLLKHCTVTNNWKVLSKHRYDDRAAWMWTLCESETDKDPFFALHPATAYAGLGPPGTMLSSTCIMCSCEIFGTGLCVVQTLSWFSLFGFPYLIITLPQLWSYSD